MADGDLSMTVTVEGVGVPVLVTAPRTGYSGQERNGTGPQGTGYTISGPSNIAREGTEGSGGQENNGTVSTGRTGTVS